MAAVFCVWVRNHHKLNGLRQHPYAPNIGAQYVRQMLTSIQEEINNNMIIVGYFNTPLTTMDRSTRQKINKEI